MPRGSKTLAFRANAGAYADAALLLAAALTFYWRILFTSHYVIPWDFQGFHLPLASVIYDAMANGGSVLWDGSTYCGRPLFADPQAQVFYPPTVAAIFIASFFPWSQLMHILEWELVLHVFAAGAFTYVLLRGLGASRPAAVCGGLIYELSGFFSSQTQHLGAVCAAAWIPLMWAAVWQLSQSLTGTWFAVLAFSGAMVILAGFPAMASTAFVSAALFALFLLFARQFQAGRLGWFSAGFALAAGLSGIILIPAAQLTFLSVAKYRSDYHTGVGFTPDIFLSLISPAASETVLNSVYCGIAGLVLAASAFWRGGFRTAVLAGLAIVSVLWIPGTLTPFGQVVWWATPHIVRGSLYPQYAIAVLCLIIAVLAGLGVDRFGRLSLALKYGLALLVAADLIVAGSGRKTNAFDVRPDPGISRHAVDGSAATLAAMRRLTDGMPPNRFDTHQMPMSFATTAPIMEIPTASGYNPMVLERITQARLSFAKGHRWGAWYEVENVDSSALNALSVRYLFSSKPLSRADRYVRRAELPGFAVYENRHALPRFWLVGDVEPASSLEDAFLRLRLADFDPARTAIVEGAGTPVPQSRGSETAGAVKILNYGPTAITLEVSAASPAFLVSSEAHYSGWTAHVDNQPAAVLMTNGAFRGVQLPAGRHLVSYRFRPWILWPAAAVTVVSFVLVALLSRRLDRTIAASQH